MQFSSRLSLLAAILTVTSVVNAVVPVPDAGAGSTCTNWAIVPGTADLSATCQRSDGSTNNARISISQCVANDNGNLSCRGKYVLSYALRASSEVPDSLWGEFSGGAGGSCVFFNVQGSAPNPTVVISAHCTLQKGSTNTVTNFDIGEPLSTHHFLPANCWTVTQAHASRTTTAT